MTSDAIFPEILYYLSDSFEIVFWTAIGVSIVFLLILILLRIREINFRKISQAALQKLLLAAVSLGLFGLFSVIGYLFWYNYKYPAPAIQFPDSILADTSWVKNDLKIYFINGNNLQSIRINGRDKKDVLIADNPIKEYHFSPNGKYILAVTSKEIYLIERNNDKSMLIDSWTREGEAGQWQGAISGIHWAPDSSHFCYEIARWSSYSSGNRVYVYDLSKKEKRNIQSPLRRISSLYWSRDGLNLYYLQNEAQDTSIRAYAFEVNVFRVPVKSLQPEFVAKIPYAEPGLPMLNLNARGIELFIEPENLSFKQGAIGSSLLVSSNGQILNIDSDDHLYYIKRKWFRTRLFRIGREAYPSDIARHQYKGGDLTITQIRWIPQGRYAIMIHRYLGVLVVEPSTRKIGLLVAALGNTFGWYSR